jgi:hypothetical protein
VLITKYRKANRTKICHNFYPVLLSLPFRHLPYCSLIKSIVFLVTPLFSFHIRRAGGSSIDGRARPQLLKRNITSTNLSIPVLGRTQSISNLKGAHNRKKLGLTIIQRLSNGLIQWLIQCNLHFRQPYHHLE